MVHQLKAFKVHKCLIKQTWKSLYYPAFQANHRQQRQPTRWRKEIMLIFNKIQLRNAAGIGYCKISMKKVILIVIHLS